MLPETTEVIELGVTVTFVLLVLDLAGLRAFANLFKQCVRASYAVVVACAIVAFASRGQWLPKRDALPAWLSGAPAWLTQQCPHAPVKATEEAPVEERIDGHKCRKTHGKQLGPLLHKARPLLAFVPGLSVWDMDYINAKYLLFAFVMLVDLVLSFHSLSAFYLILSSALCCTMNLLSAVADSIHELDKLFDGIYFDGAWLFGTPKFAVPPPAGAKVYRVDEQWRYLYSRGLKALALLDGAWNEWIEDDKDSASMPTMLHRQDVTKTVKMVTGHTNSGGRRKVTAIVSGVHAILTILATLTSPLAFGLLRVLCTLATAYVTTTSVWPDSRIVKWPKTVWPVIRDASHTFYSNLIAPLPRTAEGSPTPTPQEPNGPIDATPRTPEKKPNVKAVSISEGDEAPWIKRRVSGTEPTTPNLSDRFAKIDPKDLEFVGEIGNGGMATVQQHTWQGMNVAVKTMKRGENPKEFRREAEVLAKISHDNVMRLIGFVDLDKPMIVTEFLKGETLFKMLYETPQPPFVSKGELTNAEKCAISIGIAHGLQAIHTAKIVHQDVKPDNIIITRSPDGTIIPKVIDVGIARQANQAKPLMGTSARGVCMYMSPEQLDATEHVYSHKWDVYSYAIIVNEMVVGECSHCDRPSLPVLLEYLGTCPVSQLCDLCVSGACDSRGVCAFHSGARSGKFPWMDDAKDVPHNENYVKSKVKIGERPTPKIKARKLGSLISKCWSSDVKKRPDMSVVAAELETMRPVADTEFAA